MYNMKNITKLLCNGLPLEVPWSNVSAISLMSFDKRNVFEIITDKYS